MFVIGQVTVRERKGTETGKPRVKHFSSVSLPSTRHILICSVWLNYEFDSCLSYVWYPMPVTVMGREQRGGKRGGILRFLSLFSSITRTNTVYGNSTCTSLPPIHSEWKLAVRRFTMHRTNFQLFLCPLEWPEGKVHGRHAAGELARDPPQETRETGGGEKNGHRTACW